MIRNLQPNYALTSTYAFSFCHSSAGSAVSAVYLHVVARVIRFHSKTGRAGYPGKIKGFISICKWIHGIPLKNLDSIKCKSCSFFIIPSLYCICVIHTGQYTFIHLRFKGKRASCIYSLPFLFCEHTILPWTFSVRAETLKKRIIKFCAYKSMKPYQKIRLFCDWQFFMKFGKANSQEILFRHIKMSSRKLL